MPFTAMRALSRASGMPPPGCTLPPQKCRPCTRRWKLGCRRKAAQGELLLVPYRLPWWLEVRAPMVGGSSTSSTAIRGSTSTPSVRRTLASTSRLARAMVSASYCPTSRGALIMVNQLLHPAGASPGSRTLEMWMYTVGSWYTCSRRNRWSNSVR